MVNNTSVNIEYLKEYQRERKLNNRDLANKIGVHESTVSRILRGKKGIGYKFIIGAVYHLDGIDMNKLFIKEKVENK